MKKVLHWLAGGAAVLILLAAVFGGGFLVGRSKVKEKITVVQAETPKIDVRLPEEVEKREITEEEVYTKLVEIGELATCMGEYTVTKTAEHSRYMLENIPVPWGTNTISITCSGVVKVGYDVRELVPTVDNQSLKIYVALPEPCVLDNYIEWSSVKCAEENSMMNPIDFEQYRVLIAELEELGLAEAEKNGVYGKAEESIKVLARNFLSGFEGYEVVFV